MYFMTKSNFMIYEVSASDGSVVRALNSTIMDNDVDSIKAHLDSEAGVMYFTTKISTIRAQVCKWNISQSSVMD